MKAFTCEQNEEKQLIMRDRDRNGIVCCRIYPPSPSQGALEFSKATAVKGFVKNETKL